MSRYYVPTNLDDDPEGIIRDRFFPFIEGIVETAVELTDTQDDAYGIAMA